MTYRYLLLFTIAMLAFSAGGCATSEAQNGSKTATANASPTPPAARATPSTSITAADIAKLKWIEGTWRGMDGEKPFFERYRFEDTTMVVENLADESLTRIEDTSRFELKDGEFGSTRGSRRSAAASITSDAVQFVPVTGGGNSFRFERQSNGTWRAVLEWVDKDNVPKQKIYVMEPWPKAVKQ